MRGFLSMCFAAVVAAGWLVAAARPATAHPHVWIELRSTVVLNERGLAVALEQEWLLDEFYSLYVTNGMSAKGVVFDQAELNELARDAIENLAQSRYLTSVRVDDNEIRYGRVTTFTTGLRGEQFWLRFTLPFAAPVDPRKDALSYLVFDPYYYIEIAHAPGEPIGIKGGQAQGCRGVIEPPQPTADASRLAQSLDQNAKGPATLGELFAERVVVTCN